MAEHAKRTKLTEGQKWWLGIAVAFAIAGMCTGLWFSFRNLDSAAAAHGWATPALLPLMIDLGIPTYVIIDHLTVALGWPSRLPRFLAWGFASLTIVLNGAVVASTSVLWRVTAAAMPAAWVLGIEVLRGIWRALRKDPASRTDRIPLGRWLAAPAPTALLWRRMRLLGITSWPVMCAVEDARTWLADTIAGILEMDPDRVIPSGVKAAAKSGRFPGEVAAAVQSGPAAEWERLTGAWVAHRLGLPEAITQALSLGRPAAIHPASQGASPEPPQVPSASVARKAPAGTTRRASKGSRRKPSDDTLIETIREWGPPVTKYRIMKDCGVGDPRAQRLLDRLNAEPRLHAVSRS